MPAPTALIGHQELVGLCRALLQLSCEITPELSPEDRIDRVAAAASCLSEAPDSWLQAALEAAAEEEEA